jgi:hypothetical protein
LLISYSHFSTSEHAARPFFQPPWLLVQSLIFLHIP